MLCCYYCYYYYTGSSGFLSQATGFGINTDKNTPLLIDSVLWLLEDAYRKWKTPLIYVVPHSDLALKYYLLAFCLNALNEELWASLCGWVSLLFSSRRIFESSHFLPCQQEVEICLNPANSWGSKNAAHFWFWSVFWLSGIFGILLNHIYCSGPSAETWVRFQFRLLGQ